MDHTRSYSCAFWVSASGGSFFLSFSRQDPEGGRPMASREWTSDWPHPSARIIVITVIIISRTLSRVSKMGPGCRAGTTAGCLIVTLVRCCSSKMTPSGDWTRSAGSCAFSGRDGKLWLDRWPGFWVKGCVYIRGYW